jgi:hypothetical protein
MSNLGPPLIARAALFVSQTLGWLFGRCGRPLFNAQAGGFQFIEHILGHVERLVFGDRGEIPPDRAGDEEHQVITEHGWKIARNTLSAERAIQIAS